jgi:hypothetical protein
VNRRAYADRGRTRVRERGPDRRQHLGVERHFRTLRTDGVNATIARGDHADG